MSAHMQRKLPKSTSDDSHLAGDSEQSENKDFAGMAAEVTEGTSDDTHLAADCKRHKSAAGSSGYPPPVQEDTRHMAVNLLKSTLRRYLVSLRERGRDQHLDA